VISWSLRNGHGTEDRSRHAGLRCGPGGVASAQAVGSAGRGMTDVRAKKSLPGAKVSSPILTGAAARRRMRQALLHWFDRHRRELPWREKTGTGLPRLSGGSQQHVQGIAKATFTGYGFRKLCFSRHESLPY